MKYNIKKIAAHYALALVLTVFALAGGTPSQAAASGPTWGAPTTISAGSLNGMQSVSCVSSSFCMAVDNLGNALTYNGSSWSKYAAEPGAGFISVSCASTTLCVMVDGASNAVVYNGNFQSPTVIDLTGYATSVSCVSNTFCMTVDWDGYYLIYNGSTWTSPTDIGNGGAYLSSVSCASSSFCVAVDQNGDYLVYNGTSWSAPAPVAGGAQLNSVSCSSTSFCMTVDNSGNVSQFNGTSWSAPLNLTSISPLNSVTCASATFCMTGDNNGNVYTYDGAWSATATIDNTIGTNTSSQNNNRVNAISCASTTFCAAVDAADNANAILYKDLSAPIAGSGAVSAAAQIGTPNTGYAPPLGKTSPLLVVMSVCMISLGILLIYRSIRSLARGI